MFLMVDSPSFRKGHLDSRNRRVSAPGIDRHKAGNERVPRPLLANIYFHHVFDLWVDVWRKKYARGEIIVIRYYFNYYTVPETSIVWGLLPGARASLQGASASAP
jgi:hypothetical protein